MPSSVAHLKGVVFIFDIDDLKCISKKNWILPIFYIFGYFYPVQSNGMLDIGLWIDIGLYCMVCNHGGLCCGNWK